MQIKRKNDKKIATEELILDKKTLKPTNEEKYETILKHLGLEIEEKGENIAVKEMRKHISAYTKSMPDSSSFRSKINTMETAEEVRKCLKEYFAQ
jgi:tRNA-dihydrouridine synthase B